MGKMITAISRCSSLTPPSPPLAVPLPSEARRLWPRSPAAVVLRAWGQDTRSGLVPAGARYASITTVGTALHGSPDGYVDLVSLDITAGFVTIQVTSPSPANTATGVSPGAVLGVTLGDGTAPLNTNSVFFSYDDLPVTPVLQRPAASTTVQYQPPGLMASFHSTVTRLLQQHRRGDAPTRPIVTRLRSHPM